MIERIQADLEDAAAAQVEHSRLAQRLARLERELGQAVQEAASLRERLAAETADVERLESFSPTRIWAGLRGSREVDLDRERAEQQAAEYAVAAADATVEQLRVEAERLRRAKDVLGDPWLRGERAMAAKAEWIRSTGGPGAEELGRIGEETGVARAELTEVDEALEAAKRATAALHEAAQWLGKAKDWSTYDTFFGGGLMTDALKYDRMDKATRLIRQADGALRRLSSELADLGATGVGELGVSDLTRAFDIWFDNIFSDWSVRSRITGAQQRIDQAREAVHRIGSRLELRADELHRRLSDLGSRREELLHG